MSDSILDQAKDWPKLIALYGPCALVVFFYFFGYIFTYFATRDGSAFNQELAKKYHRYSGLMTAICTAAVLLTYFLYTTPTLREKEETNRLHDITSKIDDSKKILYDLDTLISKKQEMINCYKNKKNGIILNVPIHRTISSTNLPLYIKHDRIDQNKQRIELFYYNQNPLPKSIHIDMPSMQNKSTVTFTIKSEYFDQATGSIELKYYESDNKLPSKIIVISQDKQIPIFDESTTDFSNETDPARSSAQNAPKVGDEKKTPEVHQTPASPVASTPPTTTKSMSPDKLIPMEILNNIADSSSPLPAEKINNKQKNSIATVSVQDHHAPMTVQTDIAACFNNKEELKKCLNSDDGPTRDATRDKLVASGDTYLPEIQDFINGNEQYRVRLNAITALRKMPSDIIGNKITPETISNLLKLLTSTNYGLRINALHFFTNNSNTNPNYEFFNDVKNIYIENKKKKSPGQQLLFASQAYFEMLYSRAIWISNKKYGIDQAKLPEGNNLIAKSLAYLDEAWALRDDVKEKYKVLYLKSLYGKGVVANDRYLINLRLGNNDRTLKTTAIEFLDTFLAEYDRCENKEDYPYPNSLETAKVYRKNLLADE